MVPRVSVVIPTYNAAAVIAAAITSVAAQTFRELEAIVVDDCSTDDTVARATQALQRHGISHTVLVTQQNSGPAAARNHGVSAATGEYVAFLDADDEWLPGKLARQVQILDANPAVTLCGCQAFWVDECGRVVRPLFRNLPELLPDGWKILLWRCYVATPCAMARRQDLGDRPFDTELRVGEDRDLWIRLASKGTTALVQQAMVRIRLSKESFMCRNRDLIVENTKPMLQRHLAAFGDQLTWRDRARAIGCLNSQIGRALCTQPHMYPSGALRLLTAVLLGFQPIDNLRELIYTAPVIRPMKDSLKRRFLSNRTAAAG